MGVGGVGGGGWDGVGVGGVGVGVGWGWGEGVGGGGGWVGALDLDGPLTKSPPLQTANWGKPERKKHVF